MTATIFYECDNITYPLLNNSEVSFKTSCGLKNAIKNKINRHFDTLVRFYGNGSIVTLSAVNKENNKTIAQTKIQL